MATPTMTLHELRVYLEALEQQHGPTLPVYVGCEGCRLSLQAGNITYEGEPDAPYIELWTDFSLT